MNFLGLFIPKLQAIEFQKCIKSPQLTVHLFLKLAPEKTTTWRPPDVATQRDNMPKKISEIAHQNLRAMTWALVKFPRARSVPASFLIGLARKVEVCIIIKDQNVHARNVAKFLALGGTGLPNKFVLEY
ncbi:hypothetical protein QE152_g25291 [Popillia japonica]|uniref:Uncharacterized protein n=1 Tax=Popillia japonica TaxID=7064 RepID=A0AAW1K0K3_POPJA